MEHEHSHDHANAHDHGHEHQHQHNDHHDHHDSASCDHHNCKAEKRSHDAAFTSDHGHGHGHSHEHYEHAGKYSERSRPKTRQFKDRAFTVGIGGPVGSGKTALMMALCKKLRSEINLCCVTNDIFTREDGEFLVRNNALEEDRIMAVETGGCPHAAIREDITANLVACEELTALHHCKLILLESGGDNLAADFSRDLADFTIYVIDVAGGDKIPRKGGPGVTQSDLLVINKTDLADVVGSSLQIMDRDAKLMRGDGPTIFAQVKHDKGVDEIVAHIKAALAKAENTK